MALKDIPSGYSLLKRYNRSNKNQQLLSQSLIVDILYRISSDEGELFDCMTFGEIMKETGLSKRGLRLNLKEMCDESHRESRAIHELAVKHNFRKVEFNGTDWTAFTNSPSIRILHYPMLVSKNGIYKLHPLTKWALDNGFPPSIAPIRRRKVKKN